MNKVTGFDVSAYRQHWDRVYETDTVQLSREWHCNYERVSPVLAKYLRHATASAHTKSSNSSSTTTTTTGNNNHSSGLLIVDVGCGSSAMGVQILQEGLGLSTLLLVDASPQVLDKLQEKYGSAHQDASIAAPASSAAAAPATPAAPAAPAPAPAPAAPAPVPPPLGTSAYKLSSRVQFLLGDCRRLPLKGQSAAVVVDKGTLDALWSDAERLKMLAECLRLLSSAGIFISISFLSIRRIKMLQQAAAANRLQLHMYIVGDGDPAAGHDVRLLSVIGDDFGQVPYKADELTATVLARAMRGGSLCEREGEDVVCLQELFENDIV